MGGVDVAFAGRGANSLSVVAPCSRRPALTRLYNRVRATQNAPRGPFRLFSSVARFAGRCPAPIVARRARCPAVVESPGTPRK